MLKLIAISQADGWAIVQADGQQLLVHPPYRRFNQTPVDETYVETAVLRLGFRHLRDPIEFADWAGLIAHLNQTVAATRAELKQDIDDPTLGERTLAVAPESVLDGILDQARATQLADPTAWAGLERMLSVMLRLDQVRISQPLYAKVLDLQDTIRDSRRRRDAALSKQAEPDFAVLFPRISQQAGVDALAAFVADANHRAAPMGVDRAAA